MCYSPKDKILDSVATKDKLLSKIMSVFQVKVTSKLLQKLNLWPVSNFSLFCSKQVFGETYASQ